MKEFNIREFNRLCAELLGFKCLANGQYELPEMMTFGAKIYLEDMQYHSDWNWIMSVVDKIRTVSIPGYKFPCFEFTIENEWCIIDLHPQIDVLSENVAKDFYSHVEHRREETLKESVVQVIWQFLNWYNQNKSIS